MTRSRRPRFGADEGSTAVELAVTLGLLVMLMVGIMEFAVAFWRWNTMLVVVHDVGRYVMVKYGDNDSSTTCDTTCAKQQLADRLTEATSCSDPANPSAGQMCVNATTSGSSMILSATYGFDFLTSSPFRLTASTTVPLE